MAFRKFALMLPVAILVAGCQTDKKTAAGREQELEQRVQTLERQLLEAQMSSPSPAAPASTVEPETTASSPVVAERQVVVRTRTAPAPVVRTQTQRSPSASTAPARTASRRGDVSAEPIGSERIGRRPSAEPVGDDDDEATYERTDRVEVVQPRATSMVLPEGTELQLVLEEPLSSATSRPGDTVTARVERATSEDGSIVLPGGTVLQGRVTDTRSSGRVSGRARVAVDFDRIVVRGRTHELDVSTIVAEAPSESGRDAKVVGGSAAAGAILGAIADGKKGAVRGAVIGAGAGGAAVLVTKGREIEMPAGSRWTVRLRNSVRL
jgi:type IV secretory pathway VirB10-like protein